MCIYHVGYARRLSHLRCSRLFGFQLAAMIHARVFAAPDVGNDFIAPGIRPHHLFDPFIISAMWEDFKVGMETR